MRRWTKYIGTDADDTLIHSDPTTLPEIPNELFIGRKGNDDIYALEGGRDLIFGGAGDDRIMTGSYTKSTAFGGDGNDVMFTALDADIKLFGGAGADTFHVRDASQVMDYDPSVDILILL